MTEFRAVVDFWFAPPGHPDYGRPRALWFSKSARFDEALRARFEAHCRAALAGALDHWLAGPQSALALVLLLDQFPRNLYRGTPAAFGGDARALAAARTAIERLYDLALLPVQRWFLYLPFEHAEDMAEQRRALALFEGLRGHGGSAEAILYARRHAEVVARFGRFPHRNRILGRASTPEETAFLTQPGSSF